MGAGVGWGNDQLESSPPIHPTLYPQPPTWQTWGPQRGRRGSGSLRSTSVFGEREWGGEEEVGEGGVVAWRDGKTKAKSVSGGRGRRRDVSRESVEGGGQSEYACVYICTQRTNTTQHNTTHG